MQGKLTSGGVVSTATRDSVIQLLASGEFFWLDLNGVDDEARELLLNDFKVHRLAVEDVQHFGQRPKVEDYESLTSSTEPHPTRLPPTRCTSSLPTISWSPSTTVVRPWRRCANGSAIGRHPN
jgi:hypothetical protein